MGTLGKASFGQNIVYLAGHMLGTPPATDGQYKGTGKSLGGFGTLERTVSHEIGHSADLKGHPDPGTAPGNLMNQSKESDAGMIITKQQILQMKKSFDDGKLNRGMQIIR